MELTVLTLGIGTPFIGPHVTVINHLVQLMMTLLDGTGVLTKFNDTITRSGPQKLVLINNILSPDFGSKS